MYRQKYLCSLRYSNTTPAEAGWEGHLTLEFSNSSGGLQNLRQ